MHALAFVERCVVAQVTACPNYVPKWSLQITSINTDYESASFMNCRAYLFLAMCVAATVAENVNCWGTGANCQCTIAGSTCRAAVTCVLLAHDLSFCTFFFDPHALEAYSPFFPPKLSRAQQAI